MHRNWMHQIWLDASFWRETRKFAKAEIEQLQHQLQCKDRRVKELEGAIRQNNIVYGE